LKPEKLLLSITFSIALLFTVYSNSAYAQSSGIKITSPAEGQQIPVDIKNLPISGISSYDSTMNCHVSLIVNDVRPYQNATGNTSESDYSSWNYILNPHYTSIKQGINKLTAKLSCNDNSMNLTKFYSINLRGVKSSPTEAPKQFTTASRLLPETVSAESVLKKHHQEKTTTPMTEFKIPVAISTAWNGEGNVAIPPANNGTVGKVTIPKQPDLNNTVDQEQQNNANTPFVLAPQSSPSPPGLNNNQKSLQLPPIANPGPNQVVIAGSSVILNGSGSRAPGGIILSYSWRQIPTNVVITLSGVSTPVWEFTAPKISGDTLLRFQLNVTDNLGQTGTSIVNILDKPGNTFNASTSTTITKSPFVTEITKSPFATKRPSTLNKGSNSAIPTNNPTIAPPLIPSINSRLSPQAYEGAETPSHSYPPITNAGQDQAVNANSIVNLVAGLSKDPSDLLSYRSTQIAGIQATTLS
jgi:hypothetical protein